MNSARRSVFGLAALALLGAGLPAAAQTDTPPLKPLLTADGKASSAWRFVGFPKKTADLPPTLFEAGEVDKRPGIRVSTASSYGTWVQRWRGPVPQQMHWRWRLDEPLAGGQRSADLTTKAGDDAALKVCVMFDHALDRVPFLERTLLRIARGVSGEPLPAATLCYIWDSAGQAPREGANPYTRRVRYISLRGSETPAGQWVAEDRDVAQDFIVLFADELPQGAQTPRTGVPTVSTVLIGADSDNTASRSLGWVAELQTAPSNP